MLELMEQLNKDRVFEVEQINQRIAYIGSSLDEHAKKLARPESEPGSVESKHWQEADELRNELEHEKRDQDNRWGWSF